MKPPVGCRHPLAHDPFLIPDMEPAVERLHDAVQAHEPICFYGDYDVDGMSATALYVSFFGALGANVRAYVPHRKREGYGLNLGAVQRLHDEGISLLVTSDCGTTSHREVALAKQLGMDVIVTDHHQTDEEMPSGGRRHESASRRRSLSISGALLRRACL